jgi:heptosyltransferase II
MKIAVFLPNWLGDVAMATPALRAMRRHFGPTARIVGIMRPYLADVLAGAEWLDEQWCFNPRAKDRSQRVWAIVRRIRAEQFDMALLMTNSLRTAVIAWLGRATQRIGYVRYGRGALLTGKLFPRREGKRLFGEIMPEPMVDTYLELAYSVGCDKESPRLELATVASDRQSADAVFERLGLRSDGRVIAINSSGAYGGSKLWPVEYFAELARRIVAELDHDVLAICGPKEKDIVRRIVELSGSGRVFSMADQPMDLGTAKACIARCRLMVSTDSGPRHVAAALGLPVVTMFGPMLPIWSENPTQQAANLVLDLDCIGCHKRVCPLGHHRCMRDLTVERVFAATCDLLSRPPKKSQ